MEMRERQRSLASARGLLRGGGRVLVLARPSGGRPTRSSWFAEGISLVHLCSLSLEQSIG